jgi:hypothetical protein
MGKPPVNDKQSQQQPPHWPFDPMQPGDHEPVQLPEELERLQKQTGAGRPEQGGKRGDKA